jgi:phage shock protein PspC (stress-responsive transcriptional regulator)
MPNKSLTKSRDNKMIAGVFGGIGEYLGLSRDAITLIRIVYAVLAIPSWFSLVLVYIIVACIMPKPERNTWKTKQDFSGYSQWSGNKNTETKKRKDVTPFDDDDDWSNF